MRRQRATDLEAWFRFERGRSCGEKRRFRDEREASEAAYLVRIQTGEQLVAYQCRFCKRWHIGHPSPS